MFGAILCAFLIHLIYISKQYYIIDFLMVLQASGAISFSNIQVEFGGTNPIGLNEYYAGGTYVPSSVAVPTSGAISANSFYGKQKVVITYPVIYEFTYTGASSNVPAPDGATRMDFIAVGGGGAGGYAGDRTAGGGGGGGVMYVTGVTASTIQVYVGAGGSGIYATPGEYSEFFVANTQTSYYVDGGGEGATTGPASGGTAGSGGSGGGKSHYANSGVGTATGNGLGNAGGTSSYNSGSASGTFSGSGGGGAGGIGGNGTSTQGGNGGAGYANSLTGSSRTYGSGGGGSAQSLGGQNIPGGTGGTNAGAGARGGATTAVNGGNAPNGRGGGGGGGATGGYGGNGGNGIVIVKYYNT